ncbi:LysR family transcriptional regulator [Burkholderia glumae]|uniref:LysR substrate-binding domain-containing protein n=1 Tax=Burkholderia glumae TaxID=337 RepID=UPI000306ADDB|nr:LysR substrate-binding domain-containing protein [Burkholderia glumae]MCQ0033016.1 LysR substrate-binding domain-containing protein [Burkholderia glumae]MCQ0039631.1 LysR substrate-binding domain-containing protein [Burkholderia glumae]PJO22723.1 LysR family transcriptional regulator [Burkholderia glumae AU6208]QHE13121.1 LysR family transcriptional regulator [Burkholderia glumae AU6208]QJW82208.1 LysR family transcriptional regulator [Burkholderia glumae]
MLQLEDMQLLRALGASPSLAAAARLLDLTPPAVTVRLRRIEQRVGVSLATRAARGISLTDEGQRLIQEAIDILERIESLPSRLSDEANGVSGHLRVVAPFGFGRAYVAPLIRSLHRSHPRLAVSLILVESPLAAASGADVVISIGPIKGSPWVGHWLAPNERLLCAGPALARSLSELGHPSELGRYPYLALRENDEEVTRLRFTQHDAAGRRAGKAVTVRLTSVLSSNDGTVVRDWAADGLGVVARSEWDCVRLLAEGRLVRVLPAWRLDPAPVIALTPTRQGLTIRQRVFLDAAKRAFDPVPWRA